MGKENEEQLCTKVVGFVMHHLADAVPSEASTLWFLVISSSVQLAYSLAVRMPVPISVVLGLPTKNFGRLPRHNMLG